MTDTPIYSYDAFFLRLLRHRAHEANARDNPQTSQEAMILNKCADDLEKLYSPPMSDSKPAYTSPFDRLMK